MLWWYYLSRGSKRWGFKAIMDTQNSTRHNVNDTGNRFSEVYLSIDTKIVYIDLVFVGLFFIYFGYVILSQPHLKTPWSTRVFLAY